MRLQLAAVTVLLSLGGSACACGQSSGPTIGGRHVTSVRIVNSGGYREPSANEITQCGQVKRAVAILKRHGFFDLEARYENPRVQDGDHDRVTVEFSTGPEFIVEDINYGQPQFAAAMRELQSEGFDLPRLWHDPEPLPDGWTAPSERAPELK